MRPSQIVTREALENAAAWVAATGGSTNGVLHLLAIARELGIAVRRSTISSASPRARRSSPSLKPGGRFVATDMYEAGGIGLVARELVKARPHPRGAPNVDGRTLGRARADGVSARAGGRRADREADRSRQVASRSCAATSHPRAASSSSPGHERMLHRGPARVFDSEEDCFAAVKARTLTPGDVVVIRYEGPAGGRACARCCTSPLRSSARASARRSRSSRTGASRARPTASWSGTSRPRRSAAGRSRHSGGRHVAIDVEARELRVELSDDELAARLADWAPPPPRYSEGVFAKYAALVSSASEGAITRPPS